ncbi:class I SAM-dependent methyltransferase [Candidatus Gracilibacteria bacterium]|nr:class I SAM-dependent methyltransferase [Candidatus Gracilibacteria bacterium]
MIEQWSRAASTYIASTNAADGDSYEQQVNYPDLEKLFPAEDQARRVLDLGCGSGTCAEKLTARYRYVHAADGAPEMVAAVKQILSPALVHLIDINNCFPIGDGRFDFILAKMVLMFAEDLNSTAAEIRRILRVGGCCVVSVTHPLWWMKRYVENHSRPGSRPEMEALENGYFSPGPIHANVGIKPPVAVSFFHRTVSEYYHAFQDAGLRIDRISEPQASKEYIQAHPEDADKHLLPARLNFRAIKH